MDIKPVIINELFSDLLKIDGKTTEANAINAISEQMFDNFSSCFVENFGNAKTNLDFLGLVVGSINELLICDSPSIDF